MAKIAYTDWKTKRIPSELTTFVFWLGIVGIWIMPEISLQQRVIGCFVISVPLLLLAGIVHGSIGGGDIKLMAAGGFLLGIKGIWKSFCMGVILSSFFVVVLLIIRKVNRKTEIALGMFLCIGMLFMFLGL